jgi:hypothetical protein
MVRKGYIAILLILCLAATALNGCSASGPVYDETGELVIPVRITNTMERALKNVKSGGSSLNGRFANWHRDMIASGLEVNYMRYDEQLEMLNDLRIGAGARNTYVIYDYDAESDEYIVSMGVSRYDPPLYGFNSRREATHAIREAFEGRGTAEMFAWEDEDGAPFLSAFAPVYDENADIIAVLGLDMPAPSVLEFPEWDRDDKRWNGLTE